MSFETLLVDTCKIRSLQSTDEYGGPTVIVGSPVPCRFSPQTGRLAVGANGEDALLDGFVYVASDVAVSESDEIEVSGTIFRIIAINTHKGFNTLHHKRISVRRK